MNDGRRTWVASIAALGLIAITVSLGNWQMRRAAEKLEQQRQIDDATALEPLVLNAALLDHPSAVIGRRVRVSGRFDDRLSVFIDNRTYRGRAGFHVLTPLEIDGSERRVLVLRGWVAQDPAYRNRLPDPAAWAGEQSLLARAPPDLAQVLELCSSAAPAAQERLWHNASLDRYSQWSGLPLAGFVLRQLDTPESGPVGQVALIRDWPVPGAGVDKHRAYAFQWYSMSALTVLLWGWMLKRRRRRTSP